MWMNLENTMWSESQSLKSIYCILLLKWNIQHGQICKLRNQTSGGWDWRDGVIGKQQPEEWGFLLEWWQCSKMDSDDGYMRHAAVHGVSRSWTQLGDWITTWSHNSEYTKTHQIVHFNVRIVGHADYTSMKLWWKTSTIKPRLSPDSQITGKPF